MIADKLISNTITHLHPDDTGEQAMTMMNIFHVKHLPLVKNGKFVSLISEESLALKDLSQTIESYNIVPQGIWANRNDHMFDIMSKMAENNLTAVPILDKDETYYGLITHQELLQFYGNSFSFKEPGSIIVLETTRRQYSLAEISSIIESEGAAILSSFLTTVSDSQNVMITIKVNNFEIQRLLASLERYEYTIKASYTEQEYFDTLKDRYDLLMTYLNV